MRSAVLCLILVTGLAFGAQPKGWNFLKENPLTKKHIIAISAESFDQGSNGHAEYLHNVTVWLYDSSGNVARTVKSKEAVADLEHGTLRYGPDLNSVLSLRQ